MSPSILTVGHSNRSLEEFTTLLRTHGVTLMADVRKMPGPGRNPQFGRDTLRELLSAAGIGYVHLPALGGMRKPRPDSANGAWKTVSFRGYADYMETREFEEGLEALTALAARHCIAIMCAEAVPWRCHRSLIADALVARGIAVGHIMSKSLADPHWLQDFARIENGCVTYPAEN